MEEDRYDQGLISLSHLCLKIFKKKDILHQKNWAVDLSKQKTNINEQKYVLKKVRPQ